jgi:hypothetical protein
VDRDSISFGEGVAPRAAAKFLDKLGPATRSPLSPSARRPGAGFTSNRKLTRDELDRAIGWRTAPGDRSTSV